MPAVHTVLEGTLFSVWNPIPRHSVQCAYCVQAPGQVHGTEKEAGLSYAVVQVVHLQH